MVIICVAGCIGFETANRLLTEHRQQLTRRFSRLFLEDFTKIGKSNLTRKEIELAGIAGSMLYCNEIRSGGLLGALWAACERSGRKDLPGCRVFADAVPIRQEIVEIAELYDLDPLEISSEGAWVFLLEEEAFMKAREKMFRPLTVIGHLTEDSRRLLIRQEMERYLTPPARQQKDMERHIKIYSIGN